MILLGLTGSIGMGKSVTARMFASRGVPVYDADASVHAAYAKGGEAIAPLEWAFPGILAKDGSVDRAILKKKVINDPEAMARLEAIIHPIIGEVRNAFLEKARAEGADIAVLDIPLLYETGGEAKVAAVAVVSAPTDVQRARVLARPGMTEDEFEAILARQMPDSEKRARADFVINTGYGLDYAQSQVDEILRVLRTSGEGTEGSEGSCGKSHSTPKPPGSTRATASASSKSGA